MFKIKPSGLIFLMLNLIFMQSCIHNKQDKGSGQERFQLFVLAPAHFHAALVQKSMYPEIDSNVKVFAPEGPEVKNYLDFITEYNNRAEDPTHWNEEVYAGPGYLEKMLGEKSKQNTIVVIAGNNRKKTNYITKSIEGGLNVLADKPMTITPAGFQQLKAAFASAKKKNLLLYDIMTERYEITNILQKAFSKLPDVFGTLQHGTPDDPAVVFESVHHFYKEVSGKPLVRPDWYFDVKQQGEGLVDVTTHLIDLIQWECFPKMVLDYKKDIRILSARHWPTVLTPAQFRQVTGKDRYPGFLKSEIKDSLLQVYANGEMNYTIKGVHAKVSVIWKYEAPEGGGDTYHALLKGTKANLVIRQGKEQNYKPVLYIEPVEANNTRWENALQDGLEKIKEQYPGLVLEKSKRGWEVAIPDKYHIGHEQHFALVIKKYLQYLELGRMPEWETSFMLAKYYITTKALEMAEIK